MKIKYNLKNAHYARKQVAANGTVSYGTPKAIPGSVSISLSQEGEQVKEYADGIVWWTGSINSGYSGDYECEPLSDEFMVDCLGYIMDDNGVLVEDADATGNPFALLFEFDSDVNAVRHVLYDVRCNRPDVAGSTKEDSISPEHDKLSLTAAPVCIDGKNLVKANSTEETDATVYAGWYNAVYLPSFTEASTPAVETPAAQGENQGGTQGN